MHPAPPVVPPPLRARGDGRSIHPIVVFDGECNLCNRSVDFCLANDPHGWLRFAARQSEVGRYLRARHRVPDAVESMVLIEDQRVSLRSTASLRICHYLRQPYPFLGALGLVIPRFVRDALYGVVSSNRVRWFGKPASCRTPAPHERARFLEHPDELAPPGSGSPAPAARQRAEQVGSVGAQGRGSGA